MKYDKIVIENLVNLINNCLENNYLRILLLLITGVFMGYTLQPVPKWLDKLFNTSQILKLCVLFIAGAILVYPLNSNNIMWVLSGSIVTLIIFESARCVDNIKYNK